MASSAARRALALLLLVLLPAAPAAALTAYYVDPNWAGAQTGSASQPWTQMYATSAWATVNATLATDDVVVYHSARLAGSDTSTQAAVGILIDRTDTSTHRLTLDGLSQYNTSETTPSWVAYTGASRFTITAGQPITSDNTSSPFPDRNYVTIRGFHFIATGGSIAVLEGMNNLIFELNEGEATVTTGNGPGVSTGSQEPSPTKWPSHMILRNNTIHDSHGECFYIGGESADPPGSGTPVNTGDDILIQGNTLTDCGRYGSQGDSIDVKNGHTNLRIIGNVSTHPHYNLGTGLYDTGFNCGCNGIVVESADLIDGNYIERSINAGLVTAAAWNTQVGHNQLIIRNNVIVNTGLDGITLGNANAAAYQWSNTKVYNNSIYLVAAACIAVNAPQATVTIENNLLRACGSDGISSGTAGVLTTHDYNDFFSISGNAVSDGGVNTACAAIATVEPHSLCSDPKFVSTGTPYTATNFSLQSTSPAKGTGLNLSATFTDDYGGVTRGTTWDMGAFAVTVSPAPGAPSNLKVGVLGTGVPAH